MLGTVAPDPGVALPDNLRMLGVVPDPVDHLRRAQIVVGSAGDNVVAEMAYLRCRYIALSEPRPFDEQRFTAQALERLGLAPIVTREMREADVLPLAVARNDAATAARGDHLIFLDVDCIPGATLVSEYENAIRGQPDALHQGEVRYLPASMKGVEGALAAAGDFDEKVPRHPLHAPRIAGAPVPYDLFWPLNFACRKAVFDRIGGFDPHYRGMAPRIRISVIARGTKTLRFSPLSPPPPAFHQYHPTYDPPLNHLASIVENARAFKRRWGIWPMRAWLDAFEQEGFIAFHDDRIDVQQLPKREDIEGCLEKRFPVDAG